MEKERREGGDPTRVVIDALYDLKDQLGVDLIMKGGKWSLESGDTRVEVSVDKDGQISHEVFKGDSFAGASTSRDLEAAKKAIMDILPANIETSKTIQDIPDSGETEMGGPGLDAKLEEVQDILASSGPTEMGRGNVTRTGEEDDLAA